MSKNPKYKKVKKYCIPNLRAVDDNGNEYPVVTTIQSNYEWYTEYREKQFYKKVSIIEVVVFSFLLAIIYRKEK